MRPDLADTWQRMRVEARAADMGIDRAVYQAAGLAWDEPVLLGSGSLDAPVGFMGRDPGRHEILLREPFVGAGGRMIRDELHRRRHGCPAPDQQAATAVGRDWFWCNTVPYKPLKNKAWSMSVKRRFAPMIAAVLVQHWRGHHLVTCGREALDWFRILAPDLTGVLRDGWTNSGDFSRSLSIDFQGKTFHLHPLPHPSPLNARWHRRFPDLLRAKLDALPTR